MRRKSCKSLMILWLGTFLRKMLLEKTETFPWDLSHIGSKKLVTTFPAEILVPGNQIHKFLPSGGGGKFFGVSFKGWAKILKRQKGHRKHMGFVLGHWIPGHKIPGQKDIGFLDIGFLGHWIPKSILPSQKPAQWFMILPFGRQCILTRATHLRPSFHIAQLGNPMSWNPKSRNPKMWWHLLFLRFWPQVRSGSALFLWVYLTYFLVNIKKIKAKKKSRNPMS